MYGADHGMRSSARGLSYPRSSLHHRASQSIPNNQSPRGRLQPIKGLPPSPVGIPPGCPFHPRCPSAIELCRRVTILEKLLDQGKACHRKHEVPKMLVEVHHAEPCCRCIAKILQSTGNWFENTSRCVQLMALASTYMLVNAYRGRVGLRCRPSPAPSCV